MADQHRWFKLWCSAPADDKIQALPVPLRWAWVVLGAYTKLHGTGGVVTISASNSVLAAEMGLELAALIPTIASLPSLSVGTAPVRWPHGHEKWAVCAGEFMRGTHPLSDRGTHTLEEWCTRHGGVVVTWHNWIRYQEDSTQSVRSAASRSKRRGEENRREENRREEKRGKEHAPVRPGRSALADDEFLSALRANPAYAGIDIDQELGKLDAWLLTPRGRGKQRTRQRVVNWLNGADKPMTTPYIPRKVNDAWKGKTKPGQVQF